MKKLNKSLFIIFVYLLALVACEDHVRDSQYDAGAEGFTPLPPAFVFIYDVEYWPISGEVTSITFGVFFLDTLVHDYYLYNTLTYDNKVIKQLKVMFPKNYQGYLLQYYLSDQFWPVGEYSFAVYFGEMAVGGVPFTIEIGDGVYRVLTPHDARNRRTDLKAPINYYQMKN